MNKTYGQSTTDRRIFNFSLFDAYNHCKYDSTVTTNFNVGLLNSNINNLRGIGLNLWTGISANLTGINISSIATFIKGSSTGLTFSGALNLVGGTTKGLLAAGLVNICNQSVSGFQISGLNNLIAKNLNGVQFTLGFNTAMGQTKGIQMAGMVNIIGDSLRGLQLSGLLNLNTGTMHGIQFAPFNMADTIQRGLQLGVINVASKINQGIQLGIVNYSSDASGLNLGLINIHRSSLIKLLVYGGTFFKLNIAAVIENKYSYSVIGIGLPYDRESNFSGGIFYNLGWSIPLRKLRFNNDIGLSSITVFDNLHKSLPLHMFSLQGRSSLEYPINKTTGIFATAGYAFTRHREQEKWEGKMIIEGGLSIYITNFSKHASP